MALIEHNLLGEKIDKVKAAIDRLKSFEPEEGYYLAFSGGKDSVCVKALADMAGVRYDAHYNATTVDPPELVRFVREHHPDVEIVRPDIPMRKLIVQIRMPPTRLGRYCCAHYKERHGAGRVTLTGTRWAESNNRRKNQGLVTIFDRKASKIIEGTGANFSETTRGGVVLNYEDSPTRRTVELCYRTHKTLVNPIIDWTDEDVWEFIRSHSIPYCKLYDEGWKRLGCVGCPMGSPASMEAELNRWPALRKMYIKAFDEMVAERKKAGMPVNWETGEDVMNWWLRKSGKSEIEGQMSIWEEDAR